MPLRSRLWELFTWQKGGRVCHMPSPNSRRLGFLRWFAHVDWHIDQAQGQERVDPEDPEDQETAIRNRLEKN